jgi:hypothetical protein
VETVTGGVSDIIFRWGIVEKLVIMEGLSLQTIVLEENCLFRSVNILLEDEGQYNKLRQQQHDEFMLNLRAKSFNHQQLNLRAKSFNHQQLNLRAKSFNHQQLYLRAKSFSHQQVNLRDKSFNHQLNLRAKSSNHQQLNLRSKSFNHQNKLFIKFTMIEVYLFYFVLNHYSSSLARQPYVRPGLPQKLLPAKVSGYCFFRFRDKSLYQGEDVTPRSTPGYPVLSYPVLKRQDLALCP